MKHIAFAVMTGVTEDDGERESAGKGQCQGEHKLQLSVRRYFGGGGTISFMAAASTRVQGATDNSGVDAAVSMRWPVLRRSRASGEQAAAFLSASGM
ncbi:hypothetical protein HPB50_014863 [Hyalomma asiaticum]|uniref:Uncharacterized protein n=1 Tax=Hyalomma asiaticum TaxID=266040 RepID=A0ACB7TN12_HYAAI|nr:hypothetical protein HPB50_014863 [Hyalomma asiaticum]